MSFKISLSSFLQWRINILFFQKMGWRSALCYINLLGSLYFLFNREESLKIRKGVKKVFSDSLGPPELKSLTREVFQGILFHYYEKLFNAYSSAEALRRFFHTHVKRADLSPLSKGLSRGKGVLLVTAHFGGIEFLPGYLAVERFPVTILAKFSSAHLGEISLRKAKEFSTVIINPDATPNIMKALLENLKTNRIVITQCDEFTEWRPSSKVKVFFLGSRIELDRTIDVLIRRCRAAIVLGLMHREGNGTYRLITHSLDEMRRGIESGETTTVGELIMKVLEYYIYSYPDEWYQWKNCPGLDKGGRTDNRERTTKALWVPAFSRLS